jgi:hypothetical protein
MMAIAYHRLFPANWASWASGYPTSHQQRPLSATSKLYDHVFPVHDSNDRIQTQTSGEMNAAFSPQMV